MLNNEQQEHSSNDSEKSSKVILIRGFGFISLVIVIMAVVWFNMLSSTQDQIEEIFADQEIGRAASTMRNAAYQRALMLHRMALMEDEFDRDEEFMRFKEQAGVFIQARDLYLERSNSDKSLHPENLQAWESIRKSISDGGNWQTATAELLVNGEDEEASSMLLNDALPAQTRTMNRLSGLINKQRETTSQTAENISSEVQTSITVIIGLAIWAFVWTIGIAVFTIKRTSLVEISLHNARVDAQKADQQKSQFLANMSHEIRTPLTAIIGFSETLIDDKEKSDDWETYLRSIIRNGKHLHELINDILDLSKIEANQLTMEKIEISPCMLLFEIDSLMRGKAQSKDLRFDLDIEYPIPETITSDPTRIKQILINLCNNAIKFTTEGHITINAKYYNESGQLQINVEDSGIGMDNEQIGDLFTPFKQADSSTTRKFGGTGLGLYISKQLAESLGGDLTVDSQLGSGSIFSVTIDAGDISNGAWINTKEEALDRSSSSRNKTETPALRGKVLLAEDNMDNQRLISLHISKTGADVTVVGNGRLAVEKAISESYDLIIMDMQMPVMGGTKAIKTLRMSGCNTPVITLTANAMKEDMEESLLAGASEFLAKPIDRNAFYSALQRYLPSAKTKEERNLNKYNKQDLEGIEDLVVLYVESLPEACARIDHLLKNNDWEGLRFEIHQLKGTGGAFGFPEITEECKVIEDKIRSNDLKEASQLIINFQLTCRGIVSSEKNIEAA